MPDATAERLPPPLREALLSELDAAESLRWCAQPDIPRTRKKSFPPALLGSVVLAMVAAATVFASTQTLRELNDPSLAQLRTGGPGRSGTLVMLCVGCALGVASVTTPIIGPLVAVTRARRTVYALTNTRVMTIRVGATGARHTEAVEPGHPLSIARREHPDGTGDILLYPGTRGQRATLTLAATPDPRAAERLIRTTFDPPA